MASGSGQSGVAVGDGKRKRSKVRNRGVRGSGSGNGQEYPGDPPTLTGRRAGATEDLGFLGVIDVPKETPLLGVRTRVIVEIKCWAGKGRDFNYDVKMVKGWETLTYAEQKLVAAIVHDFARSYWKRWNPEHSAKRLNIRHVELLIRKQDLADELLIGGGLMDKHVRENPLVWMDVAAGSDEFKALKKNIAEQALPFLKTLKAAVSVTLIKSICQRNICRFCAAYCDCGACYTDVHLAQKPCPIAGTSEPRLD